MVGGGKHQYSYKIFKNMHDMAPDLIQSARIKMIERKGEPLISFFCFVNNLRTFSYKDFFGGGRTTDTIFF